MSDREALADQTQRRTKARSQRVTLAGGNLRAKQLDVLGTQFPKHRYLADLRCQGRQELLAFVHSSRGELQQDQRERAPKKPRASRFGNEHILELKPRKQLCTRAWCRNGRCQKQQDAPAKADLVAHPHPGRA